VDAAVDLGEIDRRIYGHFLEPLGRMMVGGVFAEPGSSAETFGIGYRKDVFEACRSLRATTMRWPGGCYADVYRWRDGVGEDRPTVPNRHWGKLGRRVGPIEDNRFGTEEFLWHCRTIGAEPIVCVNAGTADEEEAAAWVEYINKNPERADEADRRVRLWDIGNEQFGWWEKGHSGPRQYGRKYLRFREAMRSVDPSIETVAVGADLYKPRWNRILLDTAGEAVDYLSIHTYLPQDYKVRWLFKFPRRRASFYYSVVSASAEIERRIRTFKDQMMRSVGRIVPLAFDEWNFWYWLAQPVVPYCRFREGIAAAGVLHAFHRNNDVVKMANLSSIINVVAPPIFTDRDRLFCSSMYHTFRLYSSLSGSRRLGLKVDCGHYSADRLGGIGPVENEPLLDVSSTIEKGGNGAEDRITTFIINKDLDNAAEVELNYDRFRPADHCEVHTLAGESPYIENSFKQPNRIRPATVEIPARRHKGRFLLPPHSVSVISQTGQTG